MKNISAKYLVSALFVGLCMFAGCGDDSSSALPVAPNTGAVSSSSADLPQSEPVESSSSENIASSPASSSSVVNSGVPASSSDVAVQSSSGATPVVNGPFTFATTPGALAVAADADGFYDMGDIYKAAPKTSKIAFVIRHSKRQKSTGTESQLTPIGIQMAQTLGTKLVGDDAFYYASTDFIRTRETCKNIAAGRGETDVEVVTWDGINGGYFLTVPSDTLDAVVSKYGGNPKYIAQYSYGVPFSNAVVAATIPSYFYDLFERGNQFVNEVIVANMPSWKRVSVLVSHDMLVEPLIAFVSNRTINLKVFENPFRWVNYLSGIAVIVDEAGAVTALPVRGDEVGWMVPRDEVDESAQ
ncbi:histidine phosphatase family protein [Fibrobacter sp. UWB7]|uniref:histidine phosphatase family protein n=1 Tax=Fibrobacter sp. UWB7 TaxID=1896206 RepID=UPI00091E60D5|nr:histidine phosphatase family protein [Fibrobacter sp. UWB7]SHM09906.1 Broad specificity phosphatase PhoE [Fibrobacter sp. UWB7]